MRTFSFQNCFLFICSFLNKRIQSELDVFFGELHQLPKDIRSVTSSAFSQCRDKIKYHSFYQALLELNRFFYSNCEDQLASYHKMLVVAIDGTVITIPKNKATLARFGDNVLSESAKWLKAQVSFACAVDSMLCLDAQIGPYKESERYQCIEMIKNLPKHCLLLFDRGYFSLEVLQHLHGAGYHFCFRLKDNANKAVMEFVESSLTDKIVEFTYQNITIKTRLTKVILDTGEQEYLLTNLFDTSVFNKKELKAIYHKRWMVEEQYKDFKHAIALENFIGKKPEFILQEFYGNILMYNLSMMLFKAPVEKQLNKKPRKHKYKINKRATLSKIKQCFVDIFFDLNNRLETMIKNIIKCLVSEAIPIRDGRKYKRSETFKAKRKWANNYVPVV